MSLIQENNYNSYDDEFKVSVPLRGNVSYTIELSSNGKVLPMMFPSPYGVMSLIRKKQALNA